MHLSWSVVTISQDQCGALDLHVVLELVLRGGTPPAGKERYSQGLPFQHGYNWTLTS